jgi:hypothetical protein
VTNWSHGLWNISWPALCQLDYQEGKAFAFKLGLAFGDAATHIHGMNRHVPADYSVVVKHQDRPENSWRWEIHRAGRQGRVRRSPVNFDSMVTANKAGKEALKQLLSQLYGEASQAQE